MVKFYLWNSPVLLFSPRSQSVPRSRSPHLNCRGLDESAYSSSSSWFSQNKTYIYGLDSTYTDIKAKGFDFVRFSVDLTQYYDSANDQFYTSGSYNIENIDLFMRKFLNAGLSVHLLMGRFQNGDLDQTNDVHRTLFKKVWQRTAERYQIWSDKVAFELLNEPKGSSREAINALNSLLNETVDIIRVTNPTRYILWPLADCSCSWVLTWGSDPPNFSLMDLPENDPYIAIVVHYYGPLEFTHQGADWITDSNGNKWNYHVDLTDAYRTAIRQDLKHISLYAEAYPNVPIVLNEFGVMQGKSYESDAHEWLCTVREFCEAKSNMAWCHFEYTDFNDWKGFATRGSPTGEWRTNVVDALFPKGWDDQPSTYGQLDMSAFSKKLQVSFAGYSGTETLADFPVLVKLSTAIPGFSYSDFQLADGGDLRFADSTGKHIPHEIDTWNPNGVSTVWVRVPTLTAATRIYACYGCANPPAVTAMDVWNDDYVGVWHLNEGGLPLRESSRRSTCFVQRCGEGISFASEGVVGGSVAFDGSYSNAVIAADHDNLDGFEKFTIETWTKQSSHKASAGIIGKRMGYNKRASYYLYDNGGATILCATETGKSLAVQATISSPTLDGSWIHQACSVDTTISPDFVKGYLNGGTSATASKPSGRIYSGAGWLTLGNLNPDAKDNSFNGSIDEVRISRCVRSADWIKASHDTVTEANFATYSYDLQGLDDPEPEPVEYGPLATNAFSKSMSIRFDLLAYGVALTNFPVLVKLSTAIDGFSYSDFKKANGGDLRFADPDGNLIPHEIDTWNESGVSTVWVKIPRLTRNTIISAHYGCPGSVPAVNTKDVWDDDYAGVWHLGESALPMTESSGASVGFTQSNGSGIGFASSGIVGGAVDFGAPGNSRVLIAPDHDAFDGFDSCTFEFWTFPTNRPTSGDKNTGILSKRTGYGSNASYHIYDTGSATIVYVSSNSTTHPQVAGIGTVAPNVWTHQAITFDRGSVKDYANGAAVSSGSCAVKKINAGTADLYLGGFGSSNSGMDARNFPGRIDEVRISKTARSAAWVKATHDTIADGSFATYAVGSELEPLVNITNLLLKARTDKDNPIDYEEDEDVRFDFWLDGVEAIPSEVRAKQPLYVVWTRTADDGVAVKGTNTISLAQGFSVTTRLGIPGIVKMAGDLVGSDYKKISYVNPSDGKTKYISFGGGAGVATEKMQLSSVEPADFDRFWREAKAKLATVPFNDSNVELVDVTPSNISNSYTIYAAKIPCFGPRPVTGWLTIPKNAKPGTLPIQATFEGYGCISAKPNPPTYGAGKVMRLAINAHGYDLTGRDNQYYKDFNDYITKTNRTFNGKTYGYALAPQDYDNPTNTYFYYMAMRVMRAYDYLKSRPEWDGTNVWASGGSQGGLQTMWAGGLVDGITKIEPSITWGCDIGCPWNGNGPYPSRTWGIPCVTNAFYFDSALHAKRVPRTCIANITRLGMGDYTCPPRGVLLSYYNMKCKVSAKLVQGSDHGYVPPSPNQVFTISKEAEPAPVNVFASDAAGFDYTNCVVTVTNATAGATLTLTATASDGTTTTATAAADVNGEATFDIATAPGVAYDYAITSEGDIVATGGFLAGGWDAGGTWFSASAASGASVVAGGAWRETPEVSGSRYVVDGTADFALGSEATAAGSGRLVSIDFDYSFDSFCDEEGLSDGGGETVGGIVAAVNANGDGVWMAYGPGGWTTLYGDVAPAKGQGYIVRVEADLTANQPRVRYEVSADGGVTFAPLYADERQAERWMPGARSAATLSGVGFDGQGAVASFHGALANANVAEADGVGYASLADAVAAATNSIVLLTNATWPTNTPVGTVGVTLGGYALQGVALDGGGNAVVQSGYAAVPGGRVNISLAQVAALGVVTANKNPAQIASALAENGANGIPLWKSYVLGLDPTKADAKPAATIVMNSDSVELKLVGIDVNEASGATVTYKVYKSADLVDLEDAQPIEGEHAFDASSSLPKPASEPKMFYRLKVDVKGY